MYESKTTSKHHTVRNRGSPARNFFPVENKQTNDKLTATLILLVK